MAKSIHLSSASQLIPAILTSTQTTNFFAAGKTIISPDNSLIQTLFSYLLPMGLSLESDALMGIIYLILLFYMFMGIAIISDIFMESIESITAQTRLTTYVDSFGKEK